MFVTVMAGGGTCLENTIHYVAQRIFDHTPQVRRKFAEVCGHWLLSFPDRYSYFYKLVPLLLTCLEDSVPEVKATADEAWLRAGEQWLEENKMSDQQLKDEHDFFTEIPDHYPPDIIRPNIGCRKLVARNQHMILPCIRNDLRDWQDETRVKASQLLYLVLYHSENEVTMHIEKVIDSITVAVKDDLQEVVKYGFKSSEVLGYMVEPKIWAPLVLPRLPEQEEPSAILHALSGLVAGSERLALRVCLEDICISISQDSICQTFDENCQRRILDVVGQILVTSREDCGGTDTSGYLFKTAISVLGSGMSDPVIERARECIAGLGLLCPHKSKETLFKQHMGIMLKRLEETVSTWSSSSHDKNIFEALMAESGPAVGFFTERVVSILRKAVDEENVAETRLKLFIMLAKMMLNLKHTFDSQGQFGVCVMGFVEDIILPSLKWRGGHTEMAIRAAATSSLLCVVLALSKSSSAAESSSLDTLLG